MKARKQRSGRKTHLSDRNAELQSKSLLKKAASLLLPHLFRVSTPQLCQSPLRNAQSVTSGQRSPVAAPHAAGERCHLPHSSAAATARPPSRRSAAAYPGRARGLRGSALLSPRPCALSPAGRAAALGPAPPQGPARPGPTRPPLARPARRTRRRCHDTLKGAAAALGGY